MVGGAAGYHDHPADRRGNLLGQADFGGEVSPARDNAGRDGVAERARLLVDFFEHEVRKPALLSGHFIPGDMENFFLYLLAIIEEPHSLGSEDG